MSKETQGDSSHESRLAHPLITPNHLRRRALIYLRQSTPEQVRENTGSTEFQRRQFDLAQAYGWPDQFIEVIDEDLGKSGSSSEGRKGWQEMLKRIASNDVGAVFATNISRLSRRLIDFEELRILAGYHDVLLVIDGRIVDPTDANDAVLSQITATFAQFENRKRAEVMSQARLAKARQGFVVSQLPIGWVKNPDGTYDHDPKVKDVIGIIIETFWRVRTLAGTVVALVEAGVKIPSRQRKQIVWGRPSLSAVRSILTKPAYSGTYVYGKTKCTPELGIRPNGEAVRKRIPEHLRVKIPNHLPPYMGPQDQAQIREILRANWFPRRDRPGRGSALCQGLLYCTPCESRLSVFYHRKDGHTYCCGWKRMYGEKAHFFFTGRDFDKAVARQVLAILSTPPVEFLKEALQESHKAAETKSAWVKTERERLQHEEQKVLELLDHSHGDFPRVIVHAKQKLESVLERKEEFERRVAAEAPASNAEGTNEELEELCTLASEVPKLWQHPVVTPQERKEILRCLIEKVTVTVTRESIEGTIFWRSGQISPVKVWRQKARYNLVREIHAQGYNIAEIHERLGRGETSTGQVWKSHKLTLYHICKKLGLRLHTRPSWYEPLQKEALQLYTKGRTMRWIGEYFNSRGQKSVYGKPWTKKLIFALLESVPRKPSPLDDIHRDAILDGRCRGLKYSQMAEEFNRRGLPRRNNRPWTRVAIGERWHELSCKERKK